MQRQIILHDISEVKELIPDFEIGKNLFRKTIFYNVIYYGKYGFQADIYNKKPIKYIDTISVLYSEFFDNKTLNELNIKVENNE